MAQNESEKALKGLISEFNESVEGNQNAYTKFAENYDEVLLSLGYILPQRITEACLSELQEYHERSAILDVATGTGLVGHELRKAGYKGSIDGIDGSKEMVDACKYRDVYREIKVQLLSKDQPMPYETNTYDAVICSGAMTKGHVPHECLRDMIRVLKPGGILAFNSSNFPNDPKIKVFESVVHIMDGLVKDHKCTLVKKDHDFTNFSKMSQSSTIFCYKKSEKY